MDDNHITRIGTRTLLESDDSFAVVGWAARRTVLTDRSVRAERFGARTVLLLRVVAGKAAAAGPRIKNGLHEVLRVSGLANVSEWAHAGVSIAEESGVYLGHLVLLLRRDIHRVRQGPAAYQARAGTIEFFDLDAPCAGGLVEFPVGPFQYIVTESNLVLKSATAAFPLEKARESPPVVDEVHLGCFTSDGFIPLAR